MWPAQRRVVLAVAAGEAGGDRSDSSSGEEAPDWGGSDESEEEVLVPSEPARVVKMEVDDDA
eukprot:11601598-Alexandrium_andersonii.AAC.1